MDVTWTITELADRAAAALAVDGSAQVSGRVRDLPNQRLIRWYTTIGLVDPPLGRRGRTALYGPRHLLQLVAVKRRQAAGRSIAEIQTELAGATDATLERIASLAPDQGPVDNRLAPTHSSEERARSASHRGAVPASAASPLDSAEPMATVSDQQEDGPAAIEAPAGGAPSGQEGSEEKGDPTTEASKVSRGSFWSTRPDVSYKHATVTGDYAGPHPPVVQGVRLVPGLTLLLDVPSLSGDDLAAIEHAARPLLDVLHRRGLLVSDEILARSPASLPADPSRRST